MTVLRSSLKRGLAAFAGAALVLTTGCESIGMSPAQQEEEEVVFTPPPPPVDLPPAEVPQEPEPEAAKNQVALLLPLSGPNERVGRSLANAANMALLDLGGAEIELGAYDTARSGPVAAAEAAIADGARLFLGPLLAENARAIRSVAQANGIPVLSFSNDATAAGNGVYIMGFQPDQSIARSVRYARSQGAREFAALVPSGVYGRRASQAFLDAVRSAGGQVTAVETYDRKRSALTAAVRDLTDYDARTERAASGGVVRRDGTVAQVEDRLSPVSFDALLIADGGAVAAEFLPSLRRFGAGPEQVRYIGTELWNADPRIAQAAGLHGSWFASVPDARFRQLANRYRDRFGGAPSRLASLAYDAALLAAGMAEHWPAGGDFPVARLRDPDGFVGIDGIFRFGSNGVAQRGMEVQQVAPGGSRVVSAAPKSFERGRISRLDAPGAPVLELAHLN